MKLKLNGLLTLGLFVLSKIIGNVGATETCETSDSEKQALQIPEACKAFTLTHGESSTKTMLWFLGEFHSQNQQTLACLDALTERYPTHTVLVEGAHVGQPLSCKSQGISSRKGRTCSGWDDAASVKQILDISNQKNVITCLDSWAASFSSRKLTDKVIDGAIKKALANPHQIQPKGGGRVSSTDIECMLNAARWLLAQRETGKSYKELFAQAQQKQPKVNLDLDQYDRMKQAGKKRHASLFQAIHAVPAKEPVVVIIGKHHVATDSKQTNAGLASVELANDLHQRLQTDKTIAPGSYAILAM